MVSLTAQVKDELLQLDHPNDAACLAEAAALLRYGGEFAATGRDVSISAEFPERDVAQRLADSLRTLCGVDARVSTIPPGSSSRETTYGVRVVEGGRDVIRRLKLVTGSGHPVLGMPRHIVSGTVAEVEAALRGAFLARGSLTEPGRSSSLEVASPCEEAALALVGLARRLSVAAKTKETRGVQRVFVRDGDAIGVLLSRIGAQRARLIWDEMRKKKQLTTKTGQRLATFDDANTRRSAQAAAAAALRVERAMEILGDEVPEHLAEAGQLRVEYRHASLEELGRLAEPQMTKDAVAGRIRRLLTLADKRARELGIADTQAVLETQDGETEPGSSSATE